MFTTLGMILAESDNDGSGAWDVLLGLVALAMFIYGVVLIVQARFLAGVLMFIGAALVGPGGISLLT